MGRHVEAGCKPGHKQGSGPTCTGHVSEVTWLGMGKCPMLDHMGILAVMGLRGSLAGRSPGALDPTD